MNKEKTREAIKVMQAYLDGTEIEVYVLNVWSTRSLSGTSPSWAFNEHEYRIKAKKPRIGDLMTTLQPNEIYIHAVELTKEVKVALDKAGISYSNES